MHCRSMPLQAARLAAPVSSCTRRQSSVALRGSLQCAARYERTSSSYSQRDSWESDDRGRDDSRRGGNQRDSHQDAWNSDDRRDNRRGGSQDSGRGAWGDERRGGGGSSFERSERGGRNGPVERQQQQQADQPIASNPDPEWVHYNDVYRKCEPCYPVRIAAPNKEISA